ncbi:MAG: small basic protein, partial [Verrucomicrobiales bacterium]
MSKHSSLKLKGGAEGKRSVMKRFERVKLLKQRGEWKEGQSPIGLPKT